MRTWHKDSGATSHDSLCGNRRPSWRRGILAQPLRAKARRRRVVQSVSGGRASFQAMEANRLMLSQHGSWVLSRTPPMRISNAPDSGSASRLLPGEFCFCAKLLITNDFVSYASSAACFLQLFDHSFHLAKSYDAAFPAMLKWRDKVSAHPAISNPITKHKNPRKIDSAESQAVSIMMHPEWEIDHYSIGGFVVVGPTSSSHADWKWSLTRIHPEIEAFVKSHL